MFGFSGKSVGISIKSCDPEEEELLVSHASKLYSERFDFRVE